MYFEIDTLSFIQKADGILQNKNALSLKKKKKGINIQTRNINVVR